jgi:diphthamide synthase (EF-2-diphthine--ammonia ligase)
MERALAKYHAAGVLLVAHGDIFLEDLRAYRERNLAKMGMSGVFPIWKRDTTELMHTFIAAGFKAYLSCVDGAKLGAAFAGRAIDAALLRDLPAGVDPCGEHGEYHSFVYDGPIFQRPVPVRVGEVVLRDNRYYADLLPGAEGAAERVTSGSVPPV